MKKFFCIAMLGFAIATTATAQKTIIKTESFSDTQARMLDVTAKSYVRPLVVDLVVAKGQTRKVFKHTYTRNEFEVAMERNLDNLRSRAVYDATAEWGCDAAVAATFKIELNEEQTGYTVEMKGFPANFDSNSWHPMDKSDFEWMQVDRNLSLDKVNDPDRAGAVIRNVRK